MRSQLVVVIGVVSLAGSLLSQTPQETTAVTPGRQQILVRSTRDGSLRPLLSDRPRDISGDRQPRAARGLVAHMELQSRAAVAERGGRDRATELDLSLPEFPPVSPTIIPRRVRQNGRGRTYTMPSDGRARASHDRRTANLSVRLVGGGYMALAMAGRAPELWTAVSTWAPISDLAAWHRERANDPSPTIARQILACVGGAPGESASVDARSRARSPVTTLHRATRVPIDLWAGQA